MGQREGEQDISNGGFLRGGESVLELYTVGWMHTFVSKLKPLNLYPLKGYVDNGM